MAVPERIDVGAVTLAVHVHQPLRKPEQQPAQPSAPAVPLLPGTGATAHDWDTIATHLARSRTAYALNLRGHGDSDWPGQYSLYLMTDDVIALLERLDEPTMDLVGHSLGGLVACLAAARRPQRIRRLVLEDVGMPHPRPPAAPARPAGTLPFDWRVVEQVRPQIDDPDPAWPQVMRAISAPTLVIGGGAASFVPQEYLEELVATLPDGRLQTIAAGHLVHQSEPEQFLTHLSTFLDS